MSAMCTGDSEVTLRGVDPDQCWCCMALHTRSEYVNFYCYPYAWVDPVLW